jgi:hypothetical protein
MTTLVRALVLVLCAVGPVIADDGEGAKPTPPKLDWVSGPATAKLGDVAEIKVPEGYGFLGTADTKKLLEATGRTARRWGSSRPRRAAGSPSSSGMRSAS